jgi:arsenite/tail-anchored protein-transporting ATPase
MAYLAEMSALIHLVSADRYSALHAWLLNLSLNQISNRTIELIDLTSEWMVDVAHMRSGRDCVVNHFNHAQTVDEIWCSLNPHAKEWWDLLDISTKQSFELPTLPGIEDLTRLIYLSEKLEHAADNNHIVIVLPQPIHAAKLLKMAQQGPDLIDLLLEPLLNWWDSMHHTLATVEKIFRLNLPSSQQLRLNNSWKSRLLRLQQTIKNRNYYHLSFLLDSTDYSHSQVMNRLGVLSMCDSIPHFVSLIGLEKSVADEIETSFAHSPMIISQSIEAPDLPTETQQVNRHTSLETKQWDGENNTMKVFLPGIRKEELNIQQVGQVVHLVYMGHHRAIELAEEFVSTTCERAQISSGWLTLFFRSN